MQLVSNAELHPSFLTPSLIRKSETCTCKLRRILVDIFQTFLKPLERELGKGSSYSVGMSHAVAPDGQYARRIDAINFALDNDDGARIRYYDQADLILVGVSRSGKTPTSLYLAMQYGLNIANYPLTEDDIGDDQLPDSLRKYKTKLFGLTIDPERLSSNP